ncbi:hypothetical protein LAJ19_17320 (plasmid) [Deinococcus taeanensis]|uniref:hypothetical protein n=1 Tax=Deinococcus taeanensis TaxID=2737050 RepID=UPI001CDBFC0C|nr:hypothetical protein [Deinococcus taeanensis]UBV44535.1 hypothetical protein LAJ19_17320 [Deinococcus taeanensis]
MFYHLARPLSLVAAVTSVLLASCGQTPVATAPTLSAQDVAFNASTGTGFVGKGDVQLAFGWNNQALQKNAKYVTFTYNATESYHYDCTFTVVVGRDRVAQPQTVTRGRSAAVNATITNDARVRNQITGFNLTGMSAFTSDSTVPLDGGSCPGGPLHDGVISNVTLDSASSTGGLFVNYNGVSVTLPNTPVVLATP